MQTFTPPLEAEDWLQLIRSEYAEMPGLRLTQAQAQRLWGIEPSRCRALLDTLVEQRELLPHGRRDVLPSKLLESGAR